MENNKINNKKAVSNDRRDGFFMHNTKGSIFFKTLNFLHLPPTFAPIQKEKRR
jgi:hypothetical protein